VGGNPVGCNCGKGSRKFTLTRPDGSTQVFASRLEAEAANQREGGQGSVSRS